MQFRKDINGLRAIAVIAVVLFHFNSNWMPGGFSGVDVFFVISGFLMTGIIFRGIEGNSFSVLQFYFDRANRIIPPLAGLCLVLLILGWFYLTPIDYRALGKHIVSSMGFLSNIIYWMEAGYFDAASHEKWLLHTWSLSVEWQFYILYPLVLVTMSRFLSIKAMKFTILVATVLGFIFCVIVTYKWPNPAYYLLPARSWEMMMGGVAFLYPLNVSGCRKKVLEFIGLAIILLSCFFVSKESLWPGYLSFFPVIGAFLVIQSQRNDSVLTGNAIFQYLGKWSYSIYLWHWPIVVGLYYFSLSGMFLCLGIFISVVLGYFSNRYLEGIKFSGGFDKLQHYSNWRSFYLAVFVAGIGGCGFLSNGFEWHYSRDVVVSSFEALNKNPYRCMVEKKFPCYIGNVDNVQAIIVGDSHADALTTSLANAVNLRESGIIALTKSSCPFILGVKSTIRGDECLKENNRRLDFLKNNYIDVPVFWVSRSSVYLKGQSNPARVRDVRDTKPTIYFSESNYSALNSSLIGDVEGALRKTLSQINGGRHVFLVLPTPEMRVNVPKEKSKSLLLDNDGAKVFGIDESMYIERNKEIIGVFGRLRRLSNVKLLDPTDYLCEYGFCYGEYEGRPIYYDGDHMSEFGNKILTPMFSSVIND